MARRKKKHKGKGTKSLAKKIDKLTRLVQKL